MAQNNKNKEPNTAPQPEQWYNLTLGDSFKSNSTKFCTLRYEFKPASIDKTQTGSLHKTKDNRVTVEFQNNQPGKPKLSFEGSSEEYKDNDAVLFFDGETFRLERLHTAVKRLRHVRLPGESGSASALGGGVSEAPSPPRGRGSKGQPSIKAVVNSVPVEMERIDIGESKRIDTGESKSPGPKFTGKGLVNNPPAPPLTSTESADSRNHELDLRELFEDVESENAPDKATSIEEDVNTGFDINAPNQNDMDDEIADVDLSDDETGNGPNAAEALRAQVNAGGGGGEATSSSSGSSGSGSSGSGSSSSDSEASDDSVNSV